MKISSFDTERKVFVIAEIGNNHEGNFDLAKEMIRLAASSGANAVKFQAIAPERLISSEQSERISQLQRFSFSSDQFRELSAVAEQEKVIFLATPFDLESIDWLNDLVPAWKISSGDNNFTPLLDKAASTGKPLIISLGLGYHQNANKLVSYFDDAWSRHGKAKSELALLHCVTSYPTPDEEAALGQIKSLMIPGITAGYSDHTLGVKAPELAVAAGARIIEKHFTTDNALSDFRDHKLSAAPDDFAKMVRCIRKAEKMFASDLSIQVCESGNENQIRRSIAARKDLPAGSVLKMNDFMWVRPGTGILPGGEEALIGKIITKEIKKGQLLCKSMIAKDQKE